MYTLNHRDVKFNEDKGLILLRGGIVSRRDLTDIENKEIIIKDTTFAIARRIYSYTDIDVLKNNTWNHISSGDENSLIAAFEDEVKVSNIIDSNNSINTKDIDDNADTKNTSVDTDIDNNSIEIDNSITDESTDISTSSDDDCETSDEENEISTDSEAESNTVNNAEDKVEFGDSTDSEEESNIVNNSEDKVEFVDSTDENFEDKGSDNNSTFEPSKDGTTISHNSYQNGQRVNFNHKKHRR